MTTVDIVRCDGCGGVITGKFKRFDIAIYDDEVDVPEGVPDIHDVVSLPDRAMGTDAVIEGTFERPNVSLKGDFCAECADQLTEAFDQLVAAIEEVQAGEGEKTREYQQGGCR